MRGSVGPRSRGAVTWYRVKGLGSRDKGVGFRV